jgi:hypothetical protein
LTQSNYPIQKIIDGDTFVVLTKKQADDINTIFERQKKKLAILKQDVRIKDSLLSLVSNDTIIDTRFTDRLDILEHWLLNASINGAWLYYSWEDSSIYSVNLRKYCVRKDDATGDLIFMHVDEEFPLENREYPKANWQEEIVKPRRPKVEKVEL